jgi:hypothetical protein
VPINVSEPVGANCGSDLRPRHAHWLPPPPGCLRFTEATRLCPLDGGAPDAPAPLPAVRCGWCGEPVGRAAQRRVCPEEVAALEQKLTDALLEARGVIRWVARG